MRATKAYRLVLAHADWEAAVRPLLVDAGLWAVGALRWNEDPTATELIAERLATVERRFERVERSPLTDRVVLTVEHDATTSPAGILRLIEPLASQTIAVLTLSAGERGRWDGVVHADGRCFPLEEVRVVGPGMLRLRRNPPALQPEAPAEGRWSRTIGALGPALWRQVSRAHVLLVGCGRNGTLAASQLAALGVGRLTLVDPDRLEDHNLLPGLTPQDVGEPKATALARMLVAFNPDLLVHCLCDSVTEVLDQCRARFDLIVTCVDNDAPRLAACWLARELMIPHLDLGTLVERTDDGVSHWGDARILSPFQGGGCVGCIGGLGESDAALYEFAAPPGSMHRGEPVPWHTQRAGSLVQLNALTVGAALELWLVLLAGRIGPFWQRLAWEPERGLVMQGAAVRSLKSCGFCRPAIAVSVA